MNKSVRFLVYALIFVTITRYATSPAAAVGIGVASAVVNQVTGSCGGRTKPLAVGNAAVLERAHSHERCEQRAVAATRQDKPQHRTARRTGARPLRLQSEPKQRTRRRQRGARRVSLYHRIAESDPLHDRDAGRFAGNSRHHPGPSYFSDPVSGYPLTVILVQGSAIITLPNGQQLDLSKQGTAYVLTSAGGIQGPVQWDGTIVSAAGGVSFPLYGWYSKASSRQRPAANSNRQYRSTQRHHRAAAQQLHSAA